MASQNEIRSRITQQVIEALTSGEKQPPWRRPWEIDHNAGSPFNAVTGHRYRGVNPILLGIASDRHGFQSRHWATFRQWDQLGGKVQRRPDHVRPGEWGTQIVFCSPVTKKRPESEDGEKDDKYWLLRTFTVFNIDQVAGDHLDRLRCGNAPVTALEIEQRFEEAEAAIAATRAVLRHGGNEAFYRPSGDYIQMPHKNQFALGEYWETLCHELCHWTEHFSRLNWDRTKPENNYALGELIAEIGGCYACAELGLPIADTMTNHISYLGHWLQALKSDHRFIFKATAQANRAVDYILSFSRTPTEAIEPALV